LPRRRCSTGIFACGASRCPACYSNPRGETPLALQPRWLYYAKITRSICV
jgi:hypothetical protein